jgi:hypothetical protein
MRHERALRAWHRLLAPGGVVAFSNMEEGSPRAGVIFRQCAASLGIVLEDPVAPLGTPARCRTALEEAGFSVERIVVEPIQFSAEDLQAAWTSNFGSVAYAEVRRLPEPEQIALKASFLAAIEREPVDVLSRMPMLYVIARRS